MPTLALLGDSTLDNKPYVGRHPDTAEYLRDFLAPDWSVELLARDGSRIADVPWQLAGLPDIPDCAILSVGGNDAVEHLGLLEQPASSAAEVLAELGQIADAFAKHYDPLADSVALRVRRLALCTIYEPPLLDPRTARLARVPLAVLNDRIIRCALRWGLEVIDLRAVCTQPDDFVQEIEPSPAGARKIATAIARVVTSTPSTRSARLFAA